MTLRGITLIATMAMATYAYAQTNTFPTTGNVGVGTTTPTTLFQVNGGTAQFGGAVNYARLLVDGDLTFTGTADYLVGGDRYAFRYSGNQNFGLFFSNSNSRFEFRDGSAAPVFWVTGNGNGYIKNRLHIGSQATPVATLEITPSTSAALKINPYGAFAENTGEIRMLELAANGSQFVGFKAPSAITTSRIYTLPAADGTAGQILSTNGVGELTWVSDANTTYSAGSGLLLTGTTFSNTAPDQIITLFSGGIISISGTYPNFSISATESDPTFTASPAAGITAGNISNWNTAYSWGDHALAGYLTAYTETDPVYNTSPAATINTTDISNWDAAYSWGDHTLEGYLTEFTELDPLFSAAPASGISSGDIVNWNTAYGWGDHADAGYLTEYTETDPIYIVSPAYGIDNTNISNWDAAYSWGDHAEAGYLTEYTETDPQVSSATSNMIPKWDGTTLIDGQIFDNGTRVGIGTTTPTYKLEVSEDAAFNGVRVGQGSGSVSTNTAVGNFALQSNTTGHVNTAFGSESLKDNTIGFANTAIGQSTLYHNTSGISNTAIGYVALTLNTTGHNNSALGSGSMFYNTAGEGNTAIGGSALHLNSAGNYNVAIGYTALRNTNGNENVALGNEAGFNNTSGSANVFLGNRAGYNELGSNKLYIANSSTNPPLIYGDFATAKLGLGTITPDAKLHIAGNVKIVDGTQGAGKVLTSDASGLASWQNVTYTETDPLFNASLAADINATDTANWNAAYNWGDHAHAGYLTEYTETDPVFSSSVAAGITAVDTAFWNSQLDQAWNINGNSGTVAGTHFIGTTDSAPLIFKVNNVKAGGLYQGSNVFFGYESNIGVTTASDNTGIGYRALYSNTTGEGNTALGSLALQNNINHRNTAIGFGSMQYNTTGQWNTAVGSSSLISNTSGTHNVAIGGTALQNNIDGTSNTAVGYGALLEKQSGNSNTAIGMYANKGLLNGGNNVAIGYEAGYTNTSGSGNVFIGYQAAYNESGSNKLYIANSSANPPLIYGDFAQGKIGLGTTTPTYKLEVTEDASFNGVRIGKGSGNMTHNTTTGAQALNANTSGNDNTAFGWSALSMNTGAWNNTAIGSEAMRYNTIGEHNVAVGHIALLNNTTGNGNTALGSQSLRFN